jgi:hypothetical protein
LNNLTPGYNLQVALMERRIGDVEKSLTFSANISRVELGH